MRLLRQLLPWTVALAAATCTQDRFEPSAGGVGYFSFRPVYGLAGGASLAQFGIVADSVRITLTRPVDQLVLDTTVFFPVDSAQLRLALPVQLAQSPETLTARIEIAAGGVLIFTDTLEVEVRDGPPSASNPPTATFTYVGPGRDIGTLQLVPGDTTIALGDTLFFSALAFDSAAAPVGSFYVGWKTTDTTVARINGAGRLVAPNARGSVSVVGFTPTGIVDTSVVTFAPVPVTIYADSGGGQTGIVGDSLGALFVARVMAADSQGVAGIPVRFTAVTAGGAVRDTLVFTDAQGRARTRGVLGTSAVSYNYSAAALGTALTPALFIAGATPATAAAIAIQGGNAQVDTAGRALPLPLSVQVTDAFGNPVPGATVYWSVTSGTGTVAADSSVTDGTGVAQAGYTLGLVAGTDSIQALLAGTSASVTFTATAVSAGPAAVVTLNGDSQSVAVGTESTDTIVVAVRDAADQPVAGVNVDWAVIPAVGGLTVVNQVSVMRSVSDSLGLARAVRTAGTTAQTVRIEAQVGTIIDTIIVHEVAGPAASFTIASGNGQSATAGAALPSPLVVTLQDSFGNPVAGAPVAFTVTAGGGVVDSATATTDQAGSANSGTWTLGAVAGTNQVQATTSALPADTLYFDAVGAPAGATKLWTGAVDGDWANAANWSPSGAPVSTDIVFIPASAPAATLSLADTVRDLTVESGATLTVTGATLTVTRDAAIDGGVGGTGTLALTGAGSNFHGTVGLPLVLVDGTPLLDGNVTLAGSLTVDSGLFSVNGHALAVTGDLTVQGSGQLLMTAAADSVDVGGDVNISSSTTGAGSLTNGVLVVRGNFGQTAGDAANFAAGGSHRVRFAGSVPQTVTFATPAVNQGRFQDVEFANPSGVTLAAPIAVLGTATVTSGALSGDGQTAMLAGDLVTAPSAWQVSATMFTAQPGVYPDSLPRNVVVQAPWTLSKSFTVDSTLAIVGAGDLAPGGHTLRAQDLTQQGRLRMTAAADSVVVTGILAVSSPLSGAGDLTAGTLVVGDGLVESGGAADAFRPGGTHRTVISSSGPASVVFTSAGSGFNDVTFAALGGTAVTGNFSITGTAVAQQGVMSASDTVFFSGDSLIRAPAAVWAAVVTDVSSRNPALPDSVSGALIVRDTLSLSAPLYVLDRFVVRGPAATVFLNQHLISVDAGLTVDSSGLLTMSAGDSVFSYGPATFAGRSTVGALTGGFLQLVDSFTQAGPAGSFVAGPGHVTQFAGLSPKTAQFATPGSGTGNFGTLAFSLDNGSLTLLTDVVVDSALVKPAGYDFTVNGSGTTLFVGQDLQVSGMVFDGARLVARDADNSVTFDSVTFSGQDPTATQFALTAPGGTDTLKLDDIRFLTVPTTGRYVAVADSTANGLPTQVAFFNSSPLNGAAYQLTDAAAGDSAAVLWSRLVWYTQPDTTSELVTFSAAPTVALVGPDSQPDFTHTGPVRMSLYTDPSSGTAALAGDSTNVVGGLAVFNLLTVSVAGSGYQLQASSPDFGTSEPSDPFVVLVPLPAGVTTAFNNAAGDGSWETAGNWTAGVPDSADNIFIYPSLTATVNAPARANRLILGSGAGLVLNATLTADSSVTAGNTISGGGLLIANGSGELSGQMGSLLVTGTYDVAAGDTLAAQDLTISGAGQLALAAGAIAVTDSLVTTNAGHLVVNDPAAQVTVGGNVTFAGGVSTLTAGTLALSGDLYESLPGALSADPAFLVRFEGTGRTQAVALAGTDSTTGLGQVAMQGDTLRFATNAWIRGPLTLASGVLQVADTLFTLQGITGAPAAGVSGNTLWLQGAFSHAGSYAVGTTVFGGNGISIPRLSAPYDTLVVLGNASLADSVQAAHARVMGAGHLQVAGHRFDVLGMLDLEESGVLEMTSAADTVAVGGDFLANGGSTTGLLTAGLLEIAGSFTQGNLSPVDAFHAETGHVTRFTGAGARTIFFAAPYDPTAPASGGGSLFGTLDLADGSDSLATLVPAAGAVSIGTADVRTGTLAAGGLLTVGSGAPGLAVSSLYTGGGIDYQAAPAGYTVSETFFFGGPGIPALPYQWLRVGFDTLPLLADVTASQVTVGNQGEFITDSYGGQLVLAGHTLVAGSFDAAGFGQLVMTDPADSLDVTGDFNVNGGNSTGLLTAGVVVARGNVYLASNATTGVDSTFVASGTHRLRLAAAGAADLWIDQGATAGITLNKVDVAPGATVNFDQFSTGALVAADSLFVGGGLAQGAAGRTIVARGPMFVATGGNLQVDTLELHQTVGVGDAGFDVVVTRYAGAGQVLDGLLSYQGLEVTGTASVTGNTSVSADARVRGGGRLDIGPATLAVSGTFAVLDSARLGMADPAAALTADTARFAGASTAGDLTAGTLRTRALFQASATSDSSYAPSGTFLTQIGTPAGGTEYRIQFENADGASHLQDLRLDDGGQVVVPTRIVGRVTVAGKVVTVPQGSGGIVGDPGAFLAVYDSLIINDAGTSVALDTLELHGALAVATYTLGTGVVRFAGVAQQIPDSQNFDRLEITGTASPEATLTVNATEVAILGEGRLTLGAGQEVLTSADFLTGGNGTLEMNGAGSQLWVFGNATFAGGDETGLLTDGLIRLQGNFTQLPGTATETFTTGNTGVLFSGSAATQVVTLDPATTGNFRGVGITNPNGIQISGLMVVTDSVGTSGPITGDSLWQFGNFYLNSGAQVSLRTLKTAGLFSGTPSLYAVGRTTVVNPNSLPNVAFDTLVVNANGVSAFFPISANVLIVAASGSPYASGPDGVLDLGAYSGSVRSTISGDVRVEGAGAAILLAEDTLAVGGNFTTAQGGAITMGDPNGSLEVAGTTLFGGASEIGRLTAGRLFIAGDLAQTAATSPSSFRMDGATLEFSESAMHKLAFATPDSSWLPAAVAYGAGGLHLDIVGRVRSAGGFDANGIQLLGDTLWTDGQVYAGSSQLDVSLRMYRGPMFDQFTQVASYSVGTTQFVSGAPALMPQYNFVFDTLIVSDSVVGRLSQLLKVGYLEVTGPGNPRHVGPLPGSLVLVGNDGFTLVDVAGDVLVRGAGAAIYNNDQGRLQVAGDLTVDQDAVLASNGSFGIPTMAIGGSVRMDGASTVGLLATGALEIGGDFIQGASSSTQSYAPAPAHVTRFTGSGTHRVVFATPSMAQSHFGSFSIDSGATAPNTVDLQTWAFADSVAIYGVGATFLPRITGNGNRLTSNGGFMQGADLDGVHLQFEDGGGSVSGPSLSTLTFSGYSGYSIPQLTINTVGDWIAPATWNAFDFDDTAPAPWLVVNNSGAGLQIDVFTPDFATLVGNSSVSASVTLTPSP